MKRTLLAACAAVALSTPALAQNPPVLTPAEMGRNAGLLGEAGLKCPARYEPRSLLNIGALVMMSLQRQGVPQNTINQWIVGGGGEFDGTIAHYGWKYACDRIDPVAKTASEDLGFRAGAGLP